VEGFKQNQGKSQTCFALIQLYAKRRLDKGFQFAPDSYLQNELESLVYLRRYADQMKSTQRSCRRVTDQWID
jgi:uncharacterized protein YehS (DUF1456 family)